MNEKQWSDLSVHSNLWQGGAAAGEDDTDDGHLELVVMMTTVPRLWSNCWW